MSRIYFHSESETVEVYGTERAHMGVLCAKFAAAVFDMLGWKDQLNLLPADWRSDIGTEQLGIDPRTRSAFGLFVRSSDKAFSDGREVFSTALNTVLRLGSDPMALAARIHGQCEIHGYVEPEDGEFIAGLIERALEVGIFREFLPQDGVATEHPSGWREVCRLLRAGGLVVTSYSICEGFPNAGVAAEGGAWTPETCLSCKGSGKRPTDENEVREPYTDWRGVLITGEAWDYCVECGGSGKLWDAWYDLSDDERWALAVKSVREGIKGLRWSRDGWSRFYFGDGRTALDYANGRVVGAQSHNQIKETP